MQDVEVSRTRTHALISIWWFLLSAPSIVEILVLVISTEAAVINAIVGTCTIILYVFGAYSGFMMGVEIRDPDKLSLIAPALENPLNAAHLLYSWAVWTSMNAICCWASIKVMEISVIIMVHLVILGYIFGIIVGYLKMETCPRGSEEQPILV